jgi:hypothetical protein
MYISTDGWVNACDVVIDPSYNPSRQYKLNCDVGAVFVTGEGWAFDQSIKPFLQKLPKKFKLVYGNTDRSFTRQMFYSVKDLVLHIYAVNCEFEDEMITKIPLGFFNPYVADHIKPSDKRIFCYSNFWYHRDIMNAAHTCYTIMREKCAIYFSDKSFVVGESSLSCIAYHARLSESLFVICPYGNGLDTHRFYEAAWHGARPIILSSGLDDLHLKFGAIIVKDWSEVTEEFLKQKMLEGPFNIDRRLFDVAHWLA